MDMMFVEDCCEILDSMRVPITAADREEGEYPYYGANGIQDHVADYIFDDELVLLAEDGGNFGSKERPIAYRVSGKCWVNNHAHVLKPKAGLDVDYLCYSLMFYKVDGMVNGATRQKLTQAAMRKMQIPSRSLEEQLHIVDELNRIVKIKEQRQQELQLLDDLIKARFVEMFGDPVVHLDKGETVRLDTLAEKITVGFVGEASNEYVDEGVPYLRTQNVRVNRIDLDGLIYVNEKFHNKNQKSIIHPGDVVISRVGVNRGMAAMVPDTLPEANIANCLIVGQTDNINSYYLAFYMNMSFGKRPQFGASVGSAQGVVNTSILKKWEVFVPDRILQDEFYEFAKQVDKSKFVA